MPQRRCAALGGGQPDCHSWDEARSDGPFNGFSVVFAAELSESAIVESLKAGRFYASTGLEVQTIALTDDRLEVAAEGCGRISFIGAGGELLAQVEADRATYQFSGTETYVRAQLEAGAASSVGPDDFPRMAWLQPVWVCDDAR